MIIIVRPKGNTSASSYLYTVVLHKKNWTKVTLMVEEDDKMLEQLDRHNIKYYKMEGNVVPSTRVPDHKEVLVNLVKGIEFYDSILSDILTDEQVKTVMARAQELNDAQEAKKMAEALINE